MARCSKFPTARAKPAWISARERLGRRAGAAGCLSARVAELSLLLLRRVWPGLIRRFRTGRNCRKTCYIPDGCEDVTGTFETSTDEDKTCDDVLDAWKGFGLYQCGYSPVVLIRCFCF